MAPRVRRFFCRLSPYHHHMLPPSEGRVTAASPLAYSCPLPECSSLTMHSVAVVRSLPCCAALAVLLEWPVPWDMILTNYEMNILKNFMKVCDCCASIDLRRSEVLHGYELWTLHCHCEKPGSLQCKAGGVLLAKWFYMLVYGALINQRFLWYREIVNFKMPKEVYYVGSSYVRGRHLIWLKVKHDIHAAAALEKISFGWGRFTYGHINNMIILCCTYCWDLSEIRVKCCARRTRRILLRTVKVILEEFKAPLCCSKTEVRRQRWLRKLMVYGCAIPYKVYDARPPVT
uniref:34K n=1 Tax=Simian adenovirus 13 TaxID=38432 RepID=A0A1W5PVA3_9ADEN|nr:34K [Simian adenovirus 13]